MPCVDGVYTRLLRKALDVPWQLHMTNKELYGMIPSAMDQLRQRRLSFAGHCYRCDDQPVKHLVLWEGKTGKMRRGQGNSASHTSNNTAAWFLLRNYRRELQQKMKNREEWSKISHSNSEWLQSLQMMMMMMMMMMKSWPIRLSQSLSHSVLAACRVWSFV